MPHEQKSVLHFANTSHLPRSPAHTHLCEGACVSEGRCSSLIGCQVTIYDGVPMNF